MKKYQWRSARLQKKAKAYNNWMLVFMGVVIVCLYLLPEDMKVWNFVPLTLAVIMFVMSWRVQSQDKRIRKTK